MLSDSTRDFFLDHINSELRVTGFGGAGHRTTVSGGYCLLEKGHTIRLLLPSSFLELLPEREERPRRRRDDALCALSLVLVDTCQSRR